MKKYLISSSKVSLNDFDPESLDPQFRKATKNMAMTTLALQKILDQFPTIDKENLVCIVATHFGEIESTLDFLSTQRQTKISRPILFQNSLHNSTLGFASIHLGLQGPGITISADAETISAAADCTETLLMTHDFAMVCIIDYIPSGLAERYVRNYPFLEPHLNHAKAFLFSTQAVGPSPFDISGPLKNFSFEVR